MEVTECLEKEEQFGLRRPDLTTNKFMFTFYKCHNLSLCFINIMQLNTYTHTHTQKGEKRRSNLCFLCHKSPPSECEEPDIGSRSDAFF